MSNTYTAVDLFFQKYLYYIEEEKSWVKADKILSEMTDKNDIPEAVLKAISLRDKIELNKLHGCFSEIQYFIDNFDKIKDDILKEIVVCSLFDWAFKELANECLYNKIEDTTATTAQLAKKAFDTVAEAKIKTYTSHVMQIYEKLEKAKKEKTPYTSNYILGNYYMVINPFRKKYVSYINEIKRSLKTNANNFVFDN